MASHVVSRLAQLTFTEAAVALFLLMPAVFLVVDYARVLRMRQKLPPGPFPLPLFGNYLTLPKVRPWIDYEEWAKYYNSPLLTIWIGRSPNIICNDAWTASDLMEKRAAIYSSRPRMVVMGDMMNQTESNQVCLVYGDAWRVHRRLTHTVVGTQAVRDHRDIQGNESKLLTRDILQDPEAYVMSVERYSCSVVSVLGWGRRIDKINDYVAKTALAVMEGVDFIIPGAFLMESIPELVKLPPWLYKLPSKILAESKHFQRYFYTLSKEAAHMPQDNFAKRLLREQEEQGLSNADVANLTSNLIGGGVDTTSSTMITCILAMCVFPAVQSKAQAELDAVVGQDRSPTWSDENSLPYISALVEETLRWRTVTVLGGIPHAPIKDDVYNGYHIPAGTPITGNVWAIHRHPREFPEPDNFRPERFLNGLEQPYPNKKGHNAFGWGRRQCSGQPLAQQGLLMSVARLLWAFKIRPGLDEFGREVKLDIFAYTKSENMRPEPFKAQFIPRSEKIQQILLEEAEIAREELRIYDGETSLTMENVP